MADNREELENRKEEKAAGVLNRVLDAVLILFFILAVLIGVYITYDTAYVYYHSRADVQQYKPEVINEESLKEISDECVAWVTIDETRIDFPIMQADDNIKYLNTNAYGEYALAGAIFLDFRNSSDFTDEYNLVYGHHMAEGMMFGALDAFSDEAYFREHRTGTLNVGGKEIPLRTVAFIITDVNQDPIFALNTDEDRLAFISEEAKHLNEEELRFPLLALTTCKDPATTDRTVLIMRMLTENEDLP